MDRKSKLLFPRVLVCSSLLIFGADSSLPVAETPTENAEHLVSAFEAAEKGELVKQLPDDLADAVQRASRELERHLAEQPGDVHALILSARLERIRNLITPLVWSPQESEQPPKSNLDSAHGKLDSALRQDPENAEAHYWHARLYGIHEPVMIDDILWEQARDLDKAVEHARHAVELAPEKPEYREALALYLYEGDKYDEAIEVTRELKGDRRLLHLLLTDLHAIELPPSATYSRTQTEA